MSESAGFVTIKDLAGATLATEDDDLIIQQGEETKRINLKTLGDLLVFLDKIEQVKTSTENGGINEIKATLSDGSTATFTTQNGHGIKKIEQTVKSDVSSGTNVITATLSDGQTCDFKIKNGDQGEKGDTGAALIDVVQKETSAASGGKNVISFKLNDGSYKDVEVYNGAKGETGEVSQEVLNQTVNEAIAGVVANAPSDFDTLKEMSDWISEHEDDATAMNTAILENKNSIATEITNRINADTDLQNKINNKADTASLYTTYSSVGYKTFAKLRGSLNVRRTAQATSHIIHINTMYNSVPSQSITLLVSICWRQVNIKVLDNLIYSTNSKVITKFKALLIGDGGIESDSDVFFQFYYSKSGGNDVLIDSSSQRISLGNYEIDESQATVLNEIEINDDIKTVYSTTPQKIGTWIDGKDVYRVVIENELEGNIVGQLAGTVESGAKIISAKGQITDVMEATSFLPCYHHSYNIGLSIEGNSIYFTGWSNTSFTKVMLIVEYTK